MKILVTGAKGFIGKNLIAELRNRKYEEIYEFDRDTDISLLDFYCSNCDFIFHLAGVQRPKEEKEFMEGNFGFTSILLDLLKKYRNTCPIVVSSSIQASLDNPYGKSKKAGEDLMFTYAEETGAKVMIYRFPNVYGKWNKPNYNSAITTFCYNISRNLEIKVNCRDTVMHVVYIDDLFDELISAMEGKGTKSGKFYRVPVEDETTLGHIVDLLYSFKESRNNRSIPNMNNHLERSLYSTYLSYLPEDQFGYLLKMNMNQHSSFTEIIRTLDRGQFSVNISKPGITKGNHWHHTKNEKFLVVSGHCLIQFRKIDSDEIITYDVSGEKLEVVDIPCGYTHSITNIGDTDSVTFMWCNECFDPNHPDTFFLEVKKNEKA
ncbi:nAD-dependent epimerase/dehydratase [Coprobacillus sp. CAG:826]|nr:nAD-dependent epimerase/dehydratase [Coprobacillus sp. CAG:826]